MADCEKDPPVLFASGDTVCLQGSKPVEICCCDTQNGPLNKWDYSCSKRVVPGAGGSSDPQLVTVTVSMPNVGAWGKCGAWSFYYVSENSPTDGCLIPGFGFGFASGSIDPCGNFTGTGSTTIPPRKGGSAAELLTSGTDCFGNPVVIGIRFYNHHGYDEPMHLAKWCTSIKGVAPFSVPNVDYASFDPTTFSIRKGE